MRNFKQALKKENIDCAILLNLGFEKKDSNVFYILQKDIDFACIILGQEDLVILKESEEAHLNFKTMKIGKKDKLFEILPKKLKNCSTVGINMDFISINILKLLKKHIKGKKFKDISKILVDTRKTKTSEEIKLIKKSCEISDNIINKLIKNFHKYKSQVAASIFLKNETEKAECLLAFPPIVTQDFSQIHPTNSMKKFHKGFCIIDFGVKYKGYCSDITRTIFIGKADKKSKDIYNIILKTQIATIKKLKHNIKAATIAKYTRKKLGLLDKHFSHGLGHGLGVDIHENPSISINSKEKLQTGMVFTIEPGIYFGKIGIRIEDDVLLTKNSYEVLTKTEKELIEIEI